MRRRAAAAVFLFGCALLATVPSAVRAEDSTASIASPRCEYAHDPRGLGEREPRLFWQITSSRRGERQVAYQVLVASEESRLDEARADLWNSGRVESDETTQVVYAGVPLSSRQRAVWKVRAWDRDGRATRWSSVARFEMGLLLPSDWSASWIGWPAPPQPPSESAPLERGPVEWIWCADGAPTCILRYVVDVPIGRTVASASWLLASRGSFVARIDGRQAGEQGPKPDSGRLTRVPVTRLLRPGENILEVEARTYGPSAGLAGMLHVAFADGGSMSVVTSPEWRATSAIPTTSDAATWRRAVDLGPIDECSWNVRAYRDPRAAPASYLRKDFLLRGTVAHARAYATARGIYELRINGRRVGDEFLRPGWTDYSRRMQVLTYDITAALRAGENAVGIVMADGWYAGHIGGLGRSLYGRDTRALVQIEVFYTDGGAERIVTNGSWRVSRGPVVAADLALGEAYDATRELPGWDSPGYEDASWAPPAVESLGTVPLTPQLGPSVERLAELMPVSVREAATGSGAFVVDFGQNVVGWARLRVQGQPGTTTTLRFAEALQADGRLDTASLRGAPPTDSYTLRGGAPESFEPSFTLHGFRYVEITGFPGTPSLDAVTAVVVGTASASSASLETSSALVNRLHANVGWSQRGGFVEVPATGDDRLGRLGPVGAFADAACLNADVAGFLSKWLLDVRDAQGPEGAFPDMAPVPPEVQAQGAPGWGDAGLLVPWALYECYGDTRILSAQFGSMKAWIDWVREANPDLLWVQRRGADHGDVGNVDADTPHDVLATAFFAGSARVLARTASVLGKEDDAADFELLFERIRSAFVRAFLESDGRIRGETQTAYLLALGLDLVPAERRAQVVAHLLRDIVERRGYHTSSGFLGLAQLFPTLSAVGRTDLAYRLLLSDTFPSLGYAIRRGATTLWEDWDGTSARPRLGDQAPSSLNHFASGSIGAWILGTVGGIAVDTAGPGFRRILLHPVPGGGLTFARASLDTLHGRVASHWRIRDGRLTLEILVPANTTATLFVPTADPSSVLEGGRPAAEVEGLRFLRAEPGAAVFEVGSGRYVFEAKPPDGRTSF